MFYNFLYKIRCYDSVVVLKSIKKFLVSVIILLCVKRKLMLNAIGNFISNNVGGIHSSEKRLIYTIKVSLFSEKQAHWQKMKKRGKMISKILCFFYMVVQNSCGVVIDLKSLCITDKNSDENGQLLITDTKVNDD